MLLPQGMHRWLSFRRRALKSRGEGRRTRVACAWNKAALIQAVRRLRVALRLHSVQVLPPCEQLRCWHWPRAPPAALNVRFKGGAFIGTSKGTFDRMLVRSQPGSLDVISAHLHNRRTHLCLPDARQAAQLHPKPEIQL